MKVNLMFRDDLELSYSDKQPQDNFSELLTKKEESNDSIKDIQNIM